MKLMLRQSTACRLAEFCLRKPENFLLVQRTGAGRVQIFTTADTLTPEQQAAFVQYLYAEGIITNNSGSMDRVLEIMPDQEEQPVQWIVDPTWPQVDPSYALHLQRLRLCTAATGAVFFVLMIALFCS